MHIDILVVVLCIKENLWVFHILTVFSTILITKDRGVIMMSLLQQLVTN
jgi:hypothetical protein